MSRLRILVVGLPAAAFRQFVLCRLRGHAWDDSVPSPPHRRFCGRCRRRFPR